MARDKDKRLFIRLDLDYADHPKIIGLSDAAFRAHITMMLYSRKYETDGILKKPIANRLGSQWDTDVLAELQANDEESPSLILRPDGDYELHGFSDMQETRAEIRARTERNRENGAKGGRPRKPKETDSVTGSGGDSGTQTKAETETETDIEIAKAISLSDSDESNAGDDLLDEAWQPTRQHFDKAVSLGLDPNFQLARFREHAQRNQRRQKNWNTAFTNWLKKGAEMAQQRQASGQQGYQPAQRLSAVDKARAIAADMSFGGKEIES